MRATLSFDLPEEQEEFDLANNGSNLRANIEEFDTNVLRSIVKYGDVREIAEVIRKSEYVKDQPSEETLQIIIEEIVDHLRQRLWEHINQD